MLAVITFSFLTLTHSITDARPGEFVVATASAPKDQSKDSSQNELTPEQRMAQRFPQKARVGFLIGLPVLDENDSTIGYITDVVRTRDGKIALVVPYYGWLGWVSNGGLIDRWRKPVAVPIETVAILARQVNALEFTREDFEDAPVFQKTSSVSLDPNEEILIALGRR
jgi:hypothetical protein